MKAHSLLFSLPLLLHSVAVQAIQPLATGEEDPALRPTKFAADAAEGYTSPLTGELKTLRIRGSQRTVEIMTDQFHVRRRNGTEDTVKLPETRTMSQVTEQALTMEITSAGDRADIVAYVPGRPKNDKNKMLITRKVTVRLAEGVVPSVFARTTGAVRAQRISFAPEALILTYASAVDAMEASGRLLTTPGVLDAQMVIAVKREPELMPNVQFFTYPSGPEYTPRPNSDNVEGHVCLPWLCTIINTSAYQWWANNQGTPHTAAPVGLPVDPILFFGGPANFVDPSRVDLGDFPAVGYVPTRPGVQGELSDIRLPLAWETPGDLGNPVSGRGKRILIIDDGIQKNHPDLLLAIDLNPNNHYNYFNETRNYEPLAATDPHGTSLAGFAGARIKNSGSRICGVAPNCLFQGAVAIKEFIEDTDWAQAFAQGSTLVDTNANNDLLDDDRTGILFFEICLNASSQSGSQDALDLYPEDWLWKRAIQFGATSFRRDGGRGVIYVTSAGNGGEGHMNTNYSEQKNCIYQIPVGGISDFGRRISYSASGANIVCVAPTWGEELPPLFRWPGAPNGWPNHGGHIGGTGTGPPPLPIVKNPPVEVHDLPQAWRRLTQGVPTITTGSGIDFDFRGTSASAAQVAGIVALMLEINPRLGARDVKEILLRSCRVCNDVRINTGNGIHPTQWRMGPLGRPLHYSFGAGLVDANRALKITEKWTLLPPPPLIAQQLPDVGAPDFGKEISRRVTETGGQYYGIPAQMLIPVNLQQLSGVSDVAEILLPPPPTNMRLEHVEVRVRFYHKRRGDLEITLHAPPELGWDQDQVMESRLFEPHREDYTESRWHPTVEALRQHTDWTFTTVRHWGTRIKGANPQWKLRIRDVIARGTTTNPDLGDPAYVPVANPGLVDQSTQRMFGVGVTYHGVFERTLSNEPPVVTSGRFQMAPGVQIVRTVLSVGELGRDPQGSIAYPVTNWDFFNSVDIAPMQPSHLPREPFEFFPPVFRDPLDPNVLIPLEDPTTPDDTPAGDEWPNQPRPAVWIRFDPNLPEPLVSGASGGLTQQPAWGPNRTPVELSPGCTFLVLRDKDNADPLTNYIFVRLNRLLGELDVVPVNKGKYEIKVCAENLLGISKPRTLEFNVIEDSTPDSWVDIWWDEPELSDPAIVGWNADPDKDGLENGLEYMMRLNPTLFDSSGIPDYRIEGGEVVFTWQQDGTVTQGIMHAQIADGTLTGPPDDPASVWIWSDVPANMVSEADGMLTMEVRVPIADERIFFRLYAEPPPGIP